ncbi:hypothetical protein DPMN_090802 [Dreissena polymorpha]|uniref:Uncharacterized protein n=1 Tax=Dreissena polymorpha TaxID=45954 RepID=A0A9D4KZB8_DREPO|nr:hypothetical protein DPMN_090802 [Dreissena polymorpha]
MNKANRELRKTIKDVKEESIAETSKPKTTVSADTDGFFRTIPDQKRNYLRLRWRGQCAVLRKENRRNGQPFFQAY